MQYLLTEEEYKKVGEKDRQQLIDVTAVNNILAVQILVFHGKLCKHSSDFYEGGIFTDIYGHKHIRLGRVIDCRKDCPLVALEVKCGRTFCFNPDKYK